MRIVIFIVLLIGFLFVFCSPSYDEEGFELVENYANEIKPAVEDTVYYLKVWDENKTDENLEKLYQSAMEIHNVHARYMSVAGEDDSIRDYDVSGWRIIESRNDDVLDIEGKNLARALNEVRRKSFGFAEMIGGLYHDDGEIYWRDKDDLFDRAEELMDAVDDLKWVLYKE